jgi:hypothetical protein
MLAETRQTNAVSFAIQVVLTKQETIEACNGLAAAEKALLASGAKDEASEIGRLFDHLEDCLFVT